MAAPHAAPAAGYPQWVLNMETSFRALPVTQGGGLPGLRKAAKRRLPRAAGASYPTLKHKLYTWGLLKRVDEIYFLPDIYVAPETLDQAALDAECIARGTTSGDPAWADPALGRDLL